MLIYSVEDDADIALIINKTLTKSGYEVKHFDDGKSFLSAFNVEKPSIILLDLMLPDCSGMDLLKKIREDDINDDIHVIIISAKNMVTDKVEGLDLGADDFIEKPFDLLELISRIDAHARRIKTKEIYKFGDIILNIKQRECKINDEIIVLTVKEYDILALLLKSYPNVVTREAIFKNVWDTDMILETRTLDMHIKSLRQKLGDNGQYIKTIYGVGFKISL